MTPIDTPNDLDLSTEAIAAELEEARHGKLEKVYLYGYASDEDDVLRLYQGLGVTQYYQIPKQYIVKVIGPVCPINPSLIKLLIPAATRITYVSSRKATLPAGSLAAVVASHNKDGKISPTDHCPIGCFCNGVCICADVDFWFHLDSVTAQKLGVVIEGAPAYS